VLGLADRSEERYWFGTEPADPEANLAYLGTIRAWARRHKKLKQRGLYVDIDEVGGVLAPTDVADRESLLDVISHVHQIGWQLRLGEHIEATRQAEEAREVQPRSEAQIEEMREMFSGIPEPDEAFYESLRQGWQGRRLNNEGYRLHLPDTAREDQLAGISS
jgi:AbiV